MRPHLLRWGCAEQVLIPLDLPCPSCRARRVCYTGSKVWLRHLLVLRHYLRCLNCDSRLVVTLQLTLERLDSSELSLRGGRPEQERHSK